MVFDFCGEFLSGVECGWLCVLCGCSFRVIESVSSCGGSEVLCEVFLSEIYGFFFLVLCGVGELV